MVLSAGETIIDESEANASVYFIDRCCEGFERIISNLSIGELILDGLNRYDFRIVYENTEGPAQGMSAVKLRS